MIFRKFCVSALPFSLLKDEKDGNSLFSELDNVTGDDFLQSFNSRFPISSDNSSIALEFLYSLALCHSCQLQGDNTITSEGSLPSRNPSYQSSSPDEVALCNGAAQMKMIFSSRTGDKVYVDHDSRIIEFELLATVEFSSKRKRMSTIYRYPDGRILLLVKGADSVVIDRLGLQEREKPEYTKTIEIVDRFSSEGLRTLMYAYRELTETEFLEFKRAFDAASLSLENRAALTEQVAEEIERDLKLLGATAIEDRLQEKVPETIEKMRRAGIRLWMLTGDKKETALNIAGVCKLIRPDSQVIHITGDDIDEIEISMDSAASTITEMHSGKIPKVHLVAVVKGETLTRIQAQHKSAMEAAVAAINATPAQAKKIRLTSETSKLVRFLDLAASFDNVIWYCWPSLIIISCRFSPSQKAVIVGRVKTMLNESLDGTVGLFSPKRSSLSYMQKLMFYFRLKKASGVTLAVGDGANDIPMMECAHVGVGIAGREGLAASRASDYSIAQFRFLQPLLFVHGRYSYQRTALFTLGTFYKSIIFYSCQMFFQIWTGFSGTSLFEQWTLSLWNISFSSLPVLIVGTQEKDLNISTLMAVPELYRSGQKNVHFSLPIFLRWMAQGFWVCDLS